MKEHTKVNIEIDSEDLGRLKATAASNGVSLKFLVGSAIKLYLSKSNVSLDIKIESANYRQLVYPDNYKHKRMFNGEVVTFTEAEVREYAERYLKENPHEYNPIETIERAIERLMDITRLKGLGCFDPAEPEENEPTITPNIPPASETDDDINTPF